MSSVLLRPFTRILRQRPLAVTVQPGLPLLIAATGILAGLPRFVTIEFLFRSYKQ
jgi:hypothetical protein